MYNEYSIVIRIHYATDDPEFICDYCSVDVVINGVEIISYGDSFDQDGGLAGARGFAVGFCRGKGISTTVNIMEERVADFEV
jgi:hypothetical protein